MPFNRAIKERALVAAGRRCSLCTRFKGVRLEVHHIRPEAGGGSNDFDNAIPLCFDCHADVGHYNADHPRGNRYSYTELRRHRDRLYAQVESGYLPSTDAQDEWAYCRYLICKNFSAFAEIVRGHLDRVPVENPLLADTIALPEMRRLVQIQGNNDRASNVHGDWFPNAEEYYAKHPPLEDPRDADGIVYPYFDGIRMPDEVEIRTKVGAADPLSVHLLDAGAPPEGVCVALCHDDPCGGGFPELYETRPIWAVFLEIRNISAHSVTLDTLHGLVDDPQPSCRRFVTPAGAPESMRLPSVAILPNQSVLAPLGVLLGPLQERLPSAIHGEATELARAHYQQVDRVDYSSIAHGVGLLGTMIWPSSITAERGDTSLTQQFHELDFARVYTIDRYWAMGSCPFLFFRSQDGDVQYVRELFADGLTRRTRETITVPPGVGGMIVAELERETTCVESMSVNGRHQWINLELHRGDWWELSVGCGDVIHLVGGYVPELPGRQDPLYHNQLIYDFIADQDASRATQP